MVTVEHVPYYTLEEVQAELVDARGIAAMLGITYDHARSLISRAEADPESGFPPSVLKLGTSRGWLRSQVLQWDHTRHRVLGRPPKYDDLREQLFHRYCRASGQGNYLTTGQLAEFLHTTSADMTARRASGCGPPAQRVFHDRGVSVRYDLTGLVAWLSNSCTTNAADMRQGWVSD